MKLYEISNEITAIIDALSNEDELSEDAQEKCTKQLTEHFEDKAIEIIKGCKNIEADIEALKNAEDEFKKRRKHLESKVNSLKSYLSTNMRRTAIKKIECQYFSITLKKSNPKVIIDNKENLTPDYLRIKSIIEPDKIKIAEALKTGNAELEKLAHLEESYSLLIN